MTTPVLESYNLNDSGGSTAGSIVLTKPANIVVGEMLVLIVGSDDGAIGVRFDTPSDWIKAYEFGDPLAGCRHAVYWKRARGDEPSTETINHTTNDELWGAYLRISAGAEYLFNVVPGSFGDLQEGSTTSHPITGLPLTKEALAFYVMSFDGADADFSVSGTGWEQEAEIKSGTSGTDASGVFGMRTTGATAEDSGTATVGTTVGDSSMGSQFALVIGHLFEHGLRVVQKVRANIAPGASGWSPTGTEENALREEIVVAMNDLGAYDQNTEFASSISNVIYDETLNQLGTTELEATPGEMNTALIDVEEVFADEIAGV